MSDKKVLSSSKVLNLINTSLDGKVNIIVGDESLDPNTKGFIKLMGAFGMFTAVRPNDIFIFPETIEAFGRFDSIIPFVLAHELGHLLRYHSGESDYFKMVDRVLKGEEGPSVIRNSIYSQLNRMEEGIANLFAINLCNALGDHVPQFILDEDSLYRSGLRKARLKYESDAINSMAENLLRIKL